MRIDQTLLEQRKIKVCPVVTRTTDEGREILVFRHPLAGIQLVKGTLEKEEELADAAKRELFEESGLELQSQPTFLQCWHSEHDNQVWYFFDCNIEVAAERWAHFTQDGGGHHFQFFWHPMQSPPSKDWHPVFQRALKELRNWFSVE
ncbi:DNA mismatch repair protein MutT [Veronia nyctiphanis]|uniref:DNA mismatch repair protein MutT n=2 Tax=Veronia nyctiphanis TaxID=1278244 RepID=A0A4Q0YJQ6_9GAMM|nr:DNA mismatch repair protein MutT [Veronia nyctiphanis]